MSDNLKLVLFFVVVFFANVIQTITGFAGTVLAMPFSLMLVGYEVAKPVLNILGVASSSIVVAIDRKYINIKEVIKICLIMAVGMVVGYIIVGSTNISKEILYFILAGVIIIFALIGCYTTFIKKEGLSEEKEDKKDSLLTTIMLYALLVAAGVIHGMFVCGGPLLIIYATKKFKEKNEFRSSLSLVWVVLNGVNFVKDVIAGTFNADNIGYMAMVVGIAIAVLFVAVLLGNKIAKKIDKKVFMIITYILMGISALSLILNALGVF